MDIGLEDNKQFISNIPRMCSSNISMCSSNSIMRGSNIIMFISSIIMFCSSIIMFSTSIIISEVTVLWSVVTIVFSVETLLCAVGRFARGSFHLYLVGRFALLLFKPQDLSQHIFGHMQDCLDFPSIILVECH